MNQLFNLDSKFFTFMGKVVDLMFLNLLCIIFCIPIVTAGASVTALYYVTMKMIRGEEPYILRGFLKSFRENFRQATIIHLILLAVASLLILDIRCIGFSEGAFFKMLYFVFLIFGLLYVMLLLYIYPVLARFDNTIYNTFRNAFLIAVRHLPVTVWMLGICVLPAAVAFIPNAGVQYGAMLLFMTMGFSVIAYCNSYFFMKIFGYYRPVDEQDAGQEKMYTAGLADVE